jgi:hypothetical protein
MEFGLAIILALALTWGWEGPEEDENTEAWW